MSKLALPNNIDQKSLTFIGKGIQGKVYRIDSERCIKLYNKDKYLHRELECLQKGANDPLFPRIYEWGPGYMVREYIEGIPLTDHLRNHPLTEGICRQLLALFHTLERLQFRRLDVRLDHVIINSAGIIRLIDPTNLMYMKASYPKRLLAGLRTLKLEQEFIKYVQNHEPHQADRWISHQ